MGVEWGSEPLVTQKEVMTSDEISDILVITGNYLQYIYLDMSFIGKL